MKLWQRAFRNHIAPHLSIAGLTALADALRRDDPALIQFDTVTTMTLDSSEPAIVGACAIGYCLWKSGIDRAPDLERLFEEIADHDEKSHFISWFDEIPRDIMRTQLLPEVEAVLAERMVGVLVEV